MVTALVKAQTAWEAELDTPVAVTAIIVADKLAGLMVTLSSQQTFLCSYP